LCAARVITLIQETREYRPLKRSNLTEKSRKYIHNAEQKLEDLGRRIDDLRSRQPVRPKTVTPGEGTLTIADLRRGLRTLKEQLGELKRGGADQWSSLQDATELQMWNLRAAVERLNDGSRALLARDDQDAPMYYVQKSDNGRWGLQRRDTGRAVKYFDTKKEAVQFGRRYASRRSPAKLVVRRVDGTFEAVQNYR
jgi:hypothetical protein